MSEISHLVVKDAQRIPVDKLRWCFDPKNLSFQDTGQVEACDDFVGQEDAIEALEFGLCSQSHGQNVYVRGASGTGRLTMVRRMLQKLQPTTDQLKDCCYVHNFARPDRPRLIQLPPGKAAGFSKEVKKLAEFIAEDLPKSMDAQPWAAGREEIEDQIEQAVEGITKPFEKELEAQGLAMVQMQQGPVTQTAILPVVDGQPIPPEKLKSLIAKKKADASILESYEEKMPELQKKLVEISKQASEAYREGKKKLESFTENSARKLLEQASEQLLNDFPYGAVESFVQEIWQDVTDNHLARDPKVDYLTVLTERYGVNIVLSHCDKTHRPVVEETSPSYLNMMGAVEPNFTSDGQATSDYRGISGGALLRADQGFLVLTVDDLIAEPGSWSSLMKTLRTGRLEMVPREAGMMRPNIVLQPEPIPIRVRVILIGDSASYYQLGAMDNDFREQFNVLVDLDDHLPRDAEGVQKYANVVRRICDEESLPMFKADAITALAEHGARIASSSGKLSARFGRIGDIAREAAYLTGCETNNQKLVSGADVKSAVARTKKRAGRPSRRFQEMVHNGTIVLQTQGRLVGQVNGLAVMQSGQLTYGFPARITSTIGPGKKGIINIEDQADMSGSIHTKGFHILEGLLRHLLVTNHPLTFNASIAFEQSYGGIDGDSASGAEMVCLLSSMTGIPVLQSMAITGAIDQKGNYQAIGGVNEKIEGFFDACHHFGLTGNQGVVIPRSNADDLMLREDIVQACKDGKFEIFQCDTIFQAMEIMLDRPSGYISAGSKSYPSDSVLGIAADRIEKLWRQTMVNPCDLT